MAINETLRKELFDLLLSCKERYLTVFNYVENTRGNIVVTCRRYNSLQKTIKEAFEICEKLYEEELVLEVGVPWAWQFGGRYSVYSKEDVVEKVIIYKPGKVKKIRKQLKDGLKLIHLSIQTILNKIDVKGGCFTEYVFNDTQINLIDYAQEEKDRILAEQQHAQHERINALLKGKPCAELVDFLKKNATTTDYFDQSTGQKTFYYTYETRHYDPDGSFIGYAKQRSRQLKFPEDLEDSTLE